MYYLGVAANFLALANVFLGVVGMPHSCAGEFQGKECGIQMLAGLAPYS
jgi:hypothetical protein